jgi:hypothetical protein
MKMYLNDDAEFLTKTATGFLEKSGMEKEKAIKFLKDVIRKKGFSEGIKNTLLDDACIEHAQNILKGIELL